MPGPTELMVIFGMLVLLFGADKLPRLGKSVGQSIKNFKDGLKSEESEESDKPKELKKPAKEV